MQDSIWDARALALTEAHAWEEAAARGADMSTWSVEMVSADLSEQSPDGNKACSTKTTSGHRCTLMTPLWLTLGTGELIQRAIVLTLRATELRVAWHKGARGSSVNWIGVNFSLGWEKKFLTLEISKKIVTDTLKELEDMLLHCSPRRAFAGYAPSPEDVLDRMCMTMGSLGSEHDMVSAVVTTGEADVRNGQEEARRWTRRDTRDKAAPVAVKRCKSKHSLAKLPTGSGQERG